ncbi:uncharacterized protein LOC115737460 isoform X2 [Rhodamnia argentea]|nr:uncharacterized protein LOC115737460 isoform X2 [Rhodamnia argentea]XP_048129728.1 uncharacterized protein LOC115737460 isoform X2 [Rhodamnia argentea]XP_048129729.1 uncharacterized protein LOC115737460 isoform X2 [Rhodamnia argentea]
MCTTPMQVTSSQLFATEIFPQSVVKALLYPGAVANAFLMSKTIPSYDDLLDAYNFANSKAVSSAIDLRRIEVLAGSYLMVAGALLSLMKPVRMSFFGALLVIWGLAREVMLGKTAYSNSSKSIRMYPTLFFAAVSAFASMRKDVRKIVRMCRTRKSIWID